MEVFVFLGYINIIIYKIIEDKYDYNKQLIL
jgi:hypothetical protein